MEDNYEQLRPTNRSCGQSCNPNWALDKPMIAGILLMIGSGLNISWTLFNGDFDRQPWAEEVTMMELMCAHCSWFVGAIVGGFNGGYFIDTVGRRRVMRIAIAAQLIASIIFILFSTEVIGIMLGRLVCGYGHGSAYIAVIVYAAEIATKELRGKLVAYSYLGFAIGIFIFSLVNAISTTINELDLIVVIGSITAVLSLISLPLNYFLSLESPVHQVSLEMEPDARDRFTELRDHRVMTNETRREYNQLLEMLRRDMLAADESIYKISAFYFCLFIKLGTIFIFNYPLNVTRIQSMKDLIPDFDGYGFQATILAAIRLVATILVVCTIDRFGRRNYFIMSIRLSTLTLLGLAISFACPRSVATVLFNFLFEIASTFGTLIVVDVLLGEAFTTFKKGIALSLLVCYENLVHLILIIFGVVFDVTLVYSYVILFLGFLIISLFCFLDVPETTNLLLLDTPKRFGRIRFQWKF